MKTLSIIGTRPQLVKAGIFNRRLQKQSHIEDVIVNTGQHYDYELSTIFMDQLKISVDYNLEILKGSPDLQIAHMITALNGIIKSENPDYVLVYGDTNSTLAASLSANKNNFKLVHIESGLRSYNKQMPEEINRLITDHISDILFCPTQNAVDNLKKEGIDSNVFLVGDVMFDLYKFIIESDEFKKVKNNITDKFGSDYILTTVHRSSNTDNSQNLETIVNTLNKISLERRVIFPIHPRTRKMINKFGLKLNKRINVIDPVGLFEIYSLLQNSSFVITDSGGLQKEAYFSQKICFTLRDETEWVELVDVGWNKLISPLQYNSEEISDIVKKENFQNKVEQNNLYGDGTACDKIINLLKLK